MLAMAEEEKCNPHYALNSVAVVSTWLCNLVPRVTLPSALSLSLSLQGGGS